MEKTHTRDRGRGSSVTDYWPLGALLVVGVLGAFAITYGGDDSSVAGFMHAYMGLTLTIFAFLKIVDLEGFKDGFAMYDLLAKRVSAYGYIYPFLELALGLAYLARWSPQVTYIATIALFVFGAAGVVKALQEGVDIECPCMGNVLSAPLSTVTLSEDIVMAAMAVMLLLM